MRNSLIFILCACSRLVHPRPNLGRRTRGENCDIYRTCDFNRNRDVPVCYCDSACMFYKDCCDDVMKGSLQELVHIGKEPEQYMKLNESKCAYHYGEDVGARVVSTCSNHEEKCFESRNTTVLEEVIFVTGSDGITYQNGFCAVCNGIEEFTIWSLFITFSIPSLYSAGHENCNVQFDNLNVTSNYERANFLIKHCVYKLLPPSGIMPRLCVRDKYKCSLVFLDVTPFNKSQNANPFSLHVSFNFDMEARHDIYQKGYAQSKDTSKEQEMNVRISFKNILMIHKFSMRCNYTLDLDELHMLLNSLDQYFEVVLSGIKLGHPYFIDYIIYDLNTVQIDVKNFVVADEYQEQSKVDLARKWLNRFKIKYKVSVYNSSSEAEEILYKVKSISSDIKPECSNCSYAELRVYPNYINVDKGAKLFGKVRAYYDKGKNIKRKTAFPKVMCDDIVISLAIRQDTYSIAGRCLNKGKEIMSGEPSTLNPTGNYHVMSLNCMMTFLLLSLMK